MVVEGELEKMVKKEMIEKTFVFADIHYPEHNQKALDCAEKMMAYIKPDRIVYLGDAMNMTSVSHWLENKRKSLENKRLLKDYEGFKQVKDRHRKLAGKQLKETVFIEGNHENWIKQYIDTHPEVEGLLEVGKNLEFDKYKVKFIPMNEFYKVGKLLMTHGLYTTKYHANKTLDVVGSSVLYGHTHDVQSYTKIGMVDSHAKHQATSVPCLCDMSPDYMKNRPHNWMHGCSIVYTRPNGNFNTYIVNIIDGKAILDGKLFEGK